MQKNLMVILVILILLGGGAWYMSMKKQAPQPESRELMEEPTSAPSSMSPSGASGAIGTTDKAAKEIVVEGSEFKFSPSTLTLKKGEPVTITLKNTGKMPHDLVIDELAFRTKRITSGDTDSVTFTPDKAGTFEFYCSVGKHREMGMKGTVTVQ